ncbi:hypothetical protein BKA59DRAFT_458937 [Fusarium tricinctum]|uniref:Xylanolytic transcriptional activator regulatory domain-containing protein n=1 Tax=Fusarium tricinctum TaxID=61284 RepID=A0A8K0RN14_9HYPO|nr:hypothetical protein BKA59DRAFT_458937 [Fusarium tricinctum]
MCDSLLQPASGLTVGLSPVSERASVQEWRFVKAGLLSRKACPLLTPLAREERASPMAPASVSSLIGMMLLCIAFCFLSVSNLLLNNLLEFGLGFDLMGTVWAIPKGRLPRLWQEMENENDMETSHPPAAIRRRKRKAFNAYIDGLLARIQSLESQLKHARDSNAAAQDTNNDQVDELTSRSSPEDEPLPQGDFLSFYKAYLGHSSTLSFSKNVRNLLQQSTSVTDPNGVSIEREDVSYATTLPSIGLDLVNTPYLAYNMLNTCFIQRLRAFYDVRTKEAIPEAGLWHVEMLLVFAFGESILSREHSEVGPSGMLYFTRAMEAFPDIRRLCGTPLLSIEVLCLASLFMHATDMLQESYILAFPEGLRPPDVEYMRRLWWTVYCLDRKSAALLGSPSIMRDEDISIPMPVIKVGDESQNSFAIHVALSSHLAKILDVIYGMRSQRQGRFVTEVQTILSRLAETSVVLSEHLSLDLCPSDHPACRNAATLNLLLHQVRKDTCECGPGMLADYIVCYPHCQAGSVFTRETSFKLRGRNSIVPLIFRVPLKMCVESSTRILQIIFNLKKQAMCDIFLPYDIDALFSASFALVLVDIIRPDKELLWDLPRVISLLDEFVARHVAPAKTYRLDLQKLIDLHTKVRSAGYMADQCFTATSELDVNNNAVEDVNISSRSAAISPDPIWSRVQDVENNLAPMQPDTIMSVIQNLEVEGLDLFDTTISDEAWMSEPK